MKSLVPTTALARRIAAIVHRKPETPWSEKEYRAYKKLFKDGAFNEVDIALVERYQAFQRKRKGGGFHRRGLYTLLNWWGVEVDRATEHDELHPLKPPARKILQFTPPPITEPPVALSAEDQAQADRFAAEMLARNPKSKAYRVRSEFQKVKAEIEGTA